MIKKKQQRLNKLGKRRCYVCDTIQPLDIEHFRVSKTANCGFRYECNACLKGIHNKGSLWYKYLPRARIIENKNFTCEMCGLHKGGNYWFFDLDHVTPVFVVGKRIRPSVKHIDKFQLLCPNCHRLKTIDDRSKFIRAGA